VTGTIKPLFETVHVFNYLAGVACAAEVVRSGFIKLTMTGVFKCVAEIECVGFGHICRGQCRELVDCREK